MLWDFAHGFRDLLRAHPRALPLVAASPLRTPASLVMLEHLLATMGRAHITGVQAIYTLQCLVGFVIGHTLIGQGMPPIADTEPGPNDPSVRRQFPAGQFPTLHACYQPLPSGPLSRSLSTAYTRCSKAGLEMKGRHNEMKSKTQHYTVANGAVRLAVSEAGQGQTLLFVNGGGATQVVWRNIIAALVGAYRVVTFDLRNHGVSTNAYDTSFEGFQSDLEAIMDQVVGDRPLMIGWSLGADLAVLYAAAHPGRVAGLFLIDGAAPPQHAGDALRATPHGSGWQRISPLA